MIEFENRERRQPASSLPPSIPIHRESSLYQSSEAASVPASRPRGLPSVLSGGRERSPLSVLPLPRPRGARWIFHLPFVPASHSWRPASLNISPFALFIVGLKLGSRARARARARVLVPSASLLLHARSPPTIALYSCASSPQRPSWLSPRRLARVHTRRHARVCTHTHTRNTRNTYHASPSSSRRGFLNAQRVSI